MEVFAYIINIGANDSIELIWIGAVLAVIYGIDTFIYGWLQRRRD